MIAAAFLLGAAICGMGIVRRALPSALNHAEHILWGLVIGWSLATIAAYALARISGSLSVQAVLVLTAPLWLAAVVAWLPTIRHIGRGTYNLRSIAWKQSYTPLAIVLCIFALVYFCLFTTH